jgi:hypothetical protein
MHVLYVLTNLGNNNKFYQYRQWHTTVSHIRNYYVLHDSAIMYLQKIYFSLNPHSMNIMHESSKVIYLLYTHPQIRV